MGNRIILCNYCLMPPKQITGAELYPHRPDLHHKRFYRCDPCDAHVGCHPDGAPFGRLANAELRKARQMTHASFDAYWKKLGLTRSESYRRLAEAMELSEAECHIGMFDIDQCQRAMDVCRDYQLLEKQ